MPKDKFVAGIVLIAMALVALVLTASTVVGKFYITTDDYGALFGTAFFALIFAAVGGWIASEAYHRLKKS